MTSKLKLRALSILIVFAFMLGALWLTELIFRKIENSSAVGSNLANQPHPQLGWLPKPGDYQLNSKEFKTTIHINSLSMSDTEFDPGDLELQNRILVLGDSHTFAVGASTDEAWPQQLEKLLSAEGFNGTVYNAGVIGYSVGQYLTRFRLLVEEVRPTLVIVGFSMATDLYDLIPPEKGGFVYGGNANRVYFDLDRRGELVEKYYEHVEQASSHTERSLSSRIRRFLGQFSLYRTAKRSKLAMWVAVNYRPHGESLWPGMDTALKVNLSEDDQYRWNLAAAVLGRLTTEARDKEIPTLIVNIPYLAQVYDDVWDSSFGNNPDQYERFIASSRLAKIAKQIGARFVDTTSEFIDETRLLNRWLHYPLDAHPTPEGHQLIAKIVLAEISKTRSAD